MAKAPPPPKPDAKALFAARLNDCCDKAEIPPKGKNRQATVAKRFSVSQKGARKWLEGEGLPTLEKAIEIAKSFRVALEWLLTGRGPRTVEEPPQASEIDPRVQELAERIAALSPAKQDLLFEIFTNAALSDTDPRLKDWRAPDSD